MRFRDVSGSIRAHGQQRGLLEACRDEDQTVSEHGPRQAPARAAAVAPADVENIFDAAQSVLMPFDASNASMVISSVVVDANGNARVCWSNQRNGQALVRGATVLLPDSIRVPSTSVIMATASYRYTPQTGYVLTGSFTLGDNPIYSRPRAGQAVGTGNIEQVVRTGTNPCPNFN